MPRKKSVRRSARSFVTKADDLLEFAAACSSSVSEQHISWIHDYAIIRLYRKFESLVLDALVGAINNDTATIAGRTGVKFPKHLTDEVCEYLVGDGYFDSGAEMG